MDSWVQRSDTGDELAFWRPRVPRGDADDERAIWGQRFRVDSMKAIRGEEDRGMGEGDGSGKGILANARTTS